MKCIILAAGYATRMYPLTLNFPKPLLEVGGKPILDWLCSDLFSCGVDQIYVVTNHKFYLNFDQWAQTKSKVVVLDDGTSTNETRLGALKDIAFVLDSIEDGKSSKALAKEDFFILAGDNVLDFSFKAFFAYAHKKNASCVMRHYQGDLERLRRTGVCEIDSNDRLLSMEEKPKEPKSNWAVPPFYYYKGEDLALLPEAIASGLSVDAPGSFVSYLATRRPVYAFPMNGHRFDVGTIEGYEKLKVSYKGICNSWLDNSCLSEQ
jgi:glucose-1-phosphate thymidylyltransferase